MRPHTAARRAVESAHPGSGRDGRRPRPAPPPGRAAGRDRRGPDRRERRCSMRCGVGWDGSAPIASKLEVRGVTTYVTFLLLLLQGPKTPYTLPLPYPSIMYYRKKLSVSRAKRHPSRSVARGVALQPRSSPPQLALSALRQRGSELSASSGMCADAVWSQPLAGRHHGTIGALCAFLRAAHSDLLPLPSHGSLETMQRRAVAP